ncbi:hypothetical protein QOT17_024678 [Balamuthia mandrillaris]
MDNQLQPQEENRGEEEEGWAGAQSRANERVREVDRGKSTGKTLFTMSPNKSLNCMEIPQTATSEQGWGQRLESLRRWAEAGDGRLRFTRTPGGNRLYHLDDIQCIFNQKGEQTKTEHLCYARVNRPCSTGGRSQGTVPQLRDHPRRRLRPQLHAGVAEVFRFRLLPLLVEDALDVIFYDRINSLKLRLHGGSNYEAKADKSIPPE